MKTAWILPGGGAVCVYIAGACYALHTLGVPDPDLAIASSGSSGTMAYYLARQYASIPRIWCELLSTRKFCNPLRFWKLLDVDYLIDRVMKVQEPLEVEKTRKAKTDLLIPMTDAKNGEVRYFSSKGNIDFFELLRYANAAPIFSGLFHRRVLSYEGHEYFDTRISSRPPRNINHAIQAGAKRILVVDNYHPQNSWTKGESWYRLWLKTKSTDFRKLHEKYLQNSVVIPKEVTIFHLKPQKPLGIATWNNSRTKLRRAFDQGFHETMGNEKLREFLS